MINRTFYIVSLFAIINFSGCNKPRHVLVITGGHAYDTTEFFEMFTAMEGIFFDSISHPAVTGLLNSERVHSYDLLLFYDFRPDPPLEDTTIYLQLARQGIPMLFLHHAVCSFQRWDGYRKMVGGRYVMPGYTSDTSLLSDYRHDLILRIEVLDRNHPVNSGVNDFTIHDEGYTNIQVEEGIHPLLGTSHPDCHPLVGWVNRHEQSTCLYLMMGHDKNAYQNETFQQLLENSIRWLAGEAPARK